MRPADELGQPLLQPRAEGPHSVFKRGADGRVTGYETFTPQGNLRDPKPWRSEKRVDVAGKPHYNKATGRLVPTPHVQGLTIPGGVRPAESDEIPRGWP